MSPPSDSKSICVVGAGAAGICVARRSFEQLHPTPIIRVFEQGPELGGTWAFTEENSPDTHSSMYQGLRTNIPKETMQFDDFPFEECDFLDPTEFARGESFPWHYDVLAYIQRFAEPIKHLIQYNCRVMSIERSSSSDSSKPWRVTVQNNETGEKSTEFFDAVFICSGLHSPRLPDFAPKLTGIPWSHSHSYRYAREFAGKSVAIVGARFSGSDLAQQLSECAKKVYYIHNKNDDASNPNKLLTTNLLKNSIYHNVEQCPRAVDAQPDGLILADGRVLDGSQVDHVIFCTGYRFSLPFFERNDKPIVQCLHDGSIVSQLYAHVAHVDHLDSLFFIGLNLLVLPFQLFEFQIRFALALFTKKLDKSTISKKEVLEYEENRIKELNSKGLPLKLFHELGFDQFAYCDWLDAMSMSTRKRVKAIENITRIFFDERGGHRNTNFKLVDDENFEEIHREKPKSRMTKESQQIYN